MRLSLYSQLIKNGEDHELVFDNGTDNGRIFDVRTGGMLSLPVDFNGILRMIALRQGGCILRAALRRSHENPCIPENSGRLQPVLQLLHHSVCTRALPFHAA